MPDAIVIKSAGWEGQYPTTVARVVGANKTLFFAEDLITATGAAGTGWDLRVTDLTSDTPATSLYSLNGQAATLVMRTTAQGVIQDGYWDPDDDGRNFLHTLDLAVASLVPLWQGGHVYRLCFRLNTTPWGPVMVVHEASPISVFIT